ALGVVADEHLREIRVELLDLVAELVAVLELELLLSRLLDGHRKAVAARLRLARDVGAVLRVDEDPGELLGRPVLDRALATLPDEALGARDLVVIAADHLLERASVVEGQDVETLVVAEVVDADGSAHLNSLPVKCVSFSRLWRASIRRTVPERVRITIESVIAPSRT